MSESNTGEILFYKSDEGDIKINVIFENDTIWLSQKQMGELFDCTKENIIGHLKNIFIEGEVDEKGTTKNSLVVKTDITVGKNYLSEEEIDTLNLLVSGYLDFAELQAKKGKVMYMKDWVKKTKNFLELNDMELLEGKGKIAKSTADKKATNEFEKFRVEQDRNYIGDFDKFVQEVGKKKLG